MQDTRIQLHFGGEAHSIDSNTLVNTLIHFNALVNIVNAEYGGGAKIINIQVNAPEKGSFLLGISLVEKLKGLFSKDSVSYIANIIEIVGGLFAAYKVFKGKPANMELFIQQNIQINNPQIATNIINLYNDRRAREAISKSFETLTNDESIDSFELITPTENIITYRDDFRSLVYDDFDSEDATMDEKTEEEDATLVIIALSFDKGSSWTFIHNGIRFRMQVKDDAMMEQINNGLQFGKGDAVRVRMRIIKRFNPEYRVYEIVSRRIIAFYELIKCDYKDPKLIGEG